MKCQLLLTSLILLGCNTKNSQRVSYVQPTEISTPIAFDQEITTINGIAFSEDGSTLYISAQRKDTFNNGRFFAGIQVLQFKSGNWTLPEDFQPNWKIDAYHPVLSADNKTIFFNSRSHPDSFELAIPHNIWKAEKTLESWSQPELVTGINSSSYDSYPSPGKSSNLYFNSDREGGMGGMDIYVSRFKDGVYQEPVNIEVLNSSDEENDLVIDAEERFIIFNRYIHATKSIDLFISFNSEDKWTDPRELDNINQPEKWELTPTLSPDGRYFFFELDNKIMQIELSALIYPDEIQEIGRRQK